MAATEGQRVLDLQLCGRAAPGSAIGACRSRGRAPCARAAGSGRERHPGRRGRSGEYVPSYHDRVRYPIAEGCRAVRIVSTSFGIRGSEAPTSTSFRPARHPYRRRTPDVHSPSAATYNLPDRCRSLPPAGRGRNESRPERRPGGTSCSTASTAPAPMSYLRVGFEKAKLA